MVICSKSRWRSLPSSIHFVTPPNRAPAMPSTPRFGLGTSIPSRTCTDGLTVTPSWSTMLVTPCKARWRGSSGSTMTAPTATWSSARTPATGRESSGERHFPIFTACNSRSARSAKHPSDIFRRYFPQHGICGSCHYALDRPGMDAGRRLDGPLRHNALVEAHTSNPYVRLLVRGGLNPSRSFANVLNG